MLPSSTQYVSLIPQPSQKPACKNSTENKYLYLCYQNPVKNELVHVQKRINICICEFAFETLENLFLRSSYHDLSKICHIYGLSSLKDMTAYLQEMKPTILVEQYL